MPYEFENENETIVHIKVVGVGGGGGNAIDRMVEYVSGVEFISVNTDKTIFKIVVLTLYKNDSLLNIRYYNIEMWTNYGIKIFCNIHYIKPIIYCILININKY